MSRSPVYTHSSAYAGTTPCAVRTAKPSCYSCVYSGASPKPVIADQPERPAFHRNALQQFAN